MRFIIRILANALAIYVAALYIPGVTVSGDWKFFLLAGLVLALINAILKPIFKIISLPAIILTFGLFSLVINIFIVWLFAKVVGEINISGLWAYVLTALALSIANWAVNFLFKKQTNSV